MAKSSRPPRKPSKAHKTGPAQSLVVKSGAAPEIQTVIYVHGIGNKPEASVLKCQWDTALFGHAMGDRTRMAYWVNRGYYPRPSEDVCSEGDRVPRSEDPDVPGGVVGIASVLSDIPDDRNAITAEINQLTQNARARTTLYGISARMLGRADVDTPPKGTKGVSAKVLPLPAILRRLITRFLTQVFLRDVHAFLFDKVRREEMEQSLIDRLDAGGGPFIIIAHSQGSMIAYNVLRRRQDVKVRLFVTIGSPLGIAEVQDVLRQWGPLTKPSCVDAWVNVADPRDPVAVDPGLANDFNDTTIADRKVSNPDAPHHPHSATGYLHTDPVREAVRKEAGNAFAQITGQAIIVRDLVDDIENGQRDVRHRTLIQLTAPDAASAESLSLDHVREQVCVEIERQVKRSGDQPDAAEIDKMQRFVSARLTRLELESLRTRFRNLRIERIWRDASKRALIHESTHTIQAKPANLGYAATGANIVWAVLDTGIRADHLHFHEFSNVVRQWDCTQRGAPVELGTATPEFKSLDRNGHGTHVAGIIAGRLRLDSEPNVEMCGMAPQAKLYGFKVLKDNGEGQDSWIIKALDVIAKINEDAGQLMIHGVNLSLGGGFDPSVYGCGHTPLCQELRRLWNQGVLVCLAAGNEGYAMLKSDDGDIAANMDLSIGDPANLDEAIAVGSIHKTNPHTYGVSFFSSRGPTADGRRKPDLVAPGEKILSAFHTFNGTGPRTMEKLYVQMSGTSMATPHVSGLLAAFLSMRREFIGYPNRVKDILLANCTDLRRDVYIQGAGMPNLIKMLSNT